MFGNRPYSQYFELCVPETLFEDWATVFQDHEISLRLAKAGVYQHIQTGRTAVVDTGAIDKKNVTMDKSERAVGGIFSFSSDLERKILDHDRSKPLTFLESLLGHEGIKEEHFPKSLLMYLREVAKQDESDVLIVLRTDGDRHVVQNIERYESDGDPETITRTKGGIVHAMLNRRKEYTENSHFILPIKNQRGQARFMYKSNIGQTILQNLLVHSHGS